MAPPFVSATNDHIPQHTESGHAAFLVTGGTGYIGSHTCLELLEAGHDRRRGQPEQQ